MRDLTGPSQGRDIRQLLQSLFVAECLKPSNPLWILSAWVSNIPVIDNRAQQFAAVDPDWPTAYVSLIAALRTILMRGGSVSVILRDVAHNEPFLRYLRELKKEFESSVRWYSRPEFHEKGIIGEGFLLDGSMNFTFRGIEVNDEHLIYRCDDKSIAERRLTLQEKWEHHLSD